jgi:hypothetical protein
VRFVVDKVALGQIFLRVVGFTLSISSHWCSINCKNLVKNCLSIYHHHRVAQKALRLCCEGLHHKRKEKAVLCLAGHSAQRPSFDRRSVHLRFGMGKVALGRNFYLIAVAARPKTWVCGSSLAGIVSSNPAGGMDVCLL